MRRLYLQIYLGFIAIVVLLALIALGLHRYLHQESGFIPPYVAGAVEMLGESLPPADRPWEELQEAFRTQAERLGLHGSIWSADGECLVTVGPPLSAPPIDGDGKVWLRQRHGPPGIAVRLADGRWLGVTVDPRVRLHEDYWLLGLVVFAGVVALGAYPVSRRIAGRLERLRSAVDKLGAGQLSTRIPVEGRDEVAELARTFNRTADRIQGLVSAHRRMLASASHELRSPLARLRVAVELMGAESRPELRSEAETDIAELDEMIEDLLVSASLESGERPLLSEPVDLLALLTEEAARVHAETTGASVVIQGDSRLLRRLMRNLFENARRHSSSSQVEASLAPSPEGPGVQLTVADRGPGVPDSEREHIFQPFYRLEGHSEGRDGGVGLGLALVREIARHHGGDVRCLARPGGGTCFEVTLRGVA